MFQSDSLSNFLTSQMILEICANMNHMFHKILQPEVELPSVWNVDCGGDKTQPLNHLQSIIKVALEEGHDFLALRSAQSSQKGKFTVEDCFKNTCTPPLPACMKSETRYE